MNLFESFDEIVNDEFIEKFKSYTSTHGDLNVTVKGVFYTLIAGMIRKTNSDMSAGMLFNQIEENAEKVNLPENLASIFSQESVLTKIGKDGAKIISQIFPAYKSPLLSMISTYSGVSKSTTAMAADIVANVLISMFKKEMESEKWDKETMVNTLRRHHEPLMEAIPEALLEKMVPSLGLHDLLTVRPPVTRKETTAKAREEKAREEVVQDYSSSSGTEPGRWIFAVVAALLLVGAGLYYFYFQNGDLNFFTKKEVPVESIDTPADTLQLVPEAAAPALTDDFATFKAYVLNSSEAAGREFEMPSVRFVTDSVSLETGSRAVVDSIGVLMESNPRLQIKITAFSGSGDHAFNNKRAFFVKRILTGKGINTIRIDAVSGGIGEDVTQIKVVHK